MESNRNVPVHVQEHIMRFYAEKLDREFREAFEEAEKPKQEHVGFDDTNKFFKRGKRRWAQNR